jgi:PEP-CTERM motif
VRTKDNCFFPFRCCGYEDSVTPKKGIDRKLLPFYSLAPLNSDCKKGALPQQESRGVLSSAERKSAHKDGQVQGGNMSRLRKFLITLSAVSILAMVSATAHADTITIVGVDTGQFSTATVDCTFNAQTNTFTFTITNTSAITQPGSTSTITGIGFDLPPLGNASASGLNGFSGSASGLGGNFTFSDADLGNVPHGFGSAVLDFGFITGNSGNFSGGSVNDGLAPGESMSFTVSGAAFAGFTEEQICNAIFVRFQNVNFGAGSDVGVPGTTNEIPEPSTMLLLGTALIGLGGAVRRRMKRDE